MEEDHLASRSQETADRGQDMDTQEADRANKVTAWGSVVNKNIFNSHFPQAPAPGYFTPYVGVGPSGISPLVLSELPGAGARLGGAVSHAPLKTGIGFHSAMMKHQCHCGNTRNHPENPERLVTICVMIIIIRRLVLARIYLKFIFKMCYFYIFIFRC